MSAGSAGLQALSLRFRLSKYYLTSYTRQYQRKISYFGLICEEGSPVGEFTRTSNVCHPKTACPTTTVPPRSLSISFDSSFHAYCKHYSIPGNFIHVLLLSPEKPKRAQFIYPGILAAFWNIACMLPPMYSKAKVQYNTVCSNLATSQNSEVRSRLKLRG